MEISSWSTSCPLGVYFCNSVAPQMSVKGWIPSFYSETNKITVITQKNSLAGLNFLFYYRFLTQYCCQGRTSEWSHQNKLILLNKISHLWPLDSILTVSFCYESWLMLLLLRNKLPNNSTSLFNSVNILPRKLFSVFIIIFIVIVL